MSHCENRGWSHRRVGKKTQSCGFDRRWPQPCAQSHTHQMVGAAWNTHTETHTYTHTHTYTQHTHTDTHGHTHGHRHTRTCIWAHTHKRTHTDTHTQTYTDMHTHGHTHRHIQMHTWKHTQDAELTLPTDIREQESRRKAPFQSNTLEPQRNDIDSNAIFSLWEDFTKILNKRCLNINQLLSRNYNKIFRWFYIFFNFYWVIYNVVSSRCTAKWISST